MTPVDVSDPRLHQVVELLREVTGEDDGWARRITPQTTLEGDLRLESVEMAALGDLIRHRIGPEVDLAGFLAGLDLDQLIGLTVDDLVTLVARTGGRGA